MLSLCLALFAAAQTPYLGELELVGEGQRARLVDVTGRTLSNEQALRALGLDALADEARRHQRTVTGGSIAMWSGGGLIVLGAGTLTGIANTLISNTNTNFDIPPFVVTGTGLSVVGGGLVLYFADPMKPLSAWVDPTTIASILAEQAKARESGLPPLPGDPVALPPGERNLWIDEEGALRLGSRRVDMDLAVRLFHDRGKALRYKTTRMRSKALWITLTATSEMVRLAGLTNTLLGWINISGGDTGGEGAGIGELQFYGGLVTTALGTGGVATGMTGIIGSTIKQNRAEYYYTPEELRQRVDEYNQNTPPSPTMVPMPETTLHIMPLIGVGIVGVQGTF